MFKPGYVICAMTINQAKDPQFQTGATGKMIKRLSLMLMQFIGPFTL